MGTKRQRRTASPRRHAKRSARPGGKAGGASTGRAKIAHETARPGPSSGRTSSVDVGRPWRKRTTSERDRPKGVVELLADVVRIADEARGNSKEVRHIAVLLLCPLLLGFVAVLASVAICVSSLAENMPSDIRPWAAVAVLSIATYGVAAARRKIQKSRRI